MKAAYLEEYGPEDVFKYGDLPDPVPGPRQLLIRVKAAAINRGDLNRREGNYGGGRASFPFVDGWEVAGVVEALGQGVRDRHIGQRVVATLPQGGYAELVAVNRNGTVPLPNALSFEEGASIPIAFLTSWYGLVKIARPEPGETVLVQSGGSGVGMAGIMIARYMGAKIITTVGSAEKVTRAKEIGADLAINYREQDFLPEVMRFTSDSGVNVVLETVGGEVLTKSIDSLAPLGRLVVLGNSSRIPDPPDLMDRLARRNITYNRFGLGSQMAYGGVMAELARIMDLCSQGKMRTVVDRVFPLKEAAEAHRYVAQRKHFGKVILRP